MEEMRSDEEKVNHYFRRMSFIDKANLLFILIKLDWFIKVNGQILKKLKMGHPLKTFLMSPHYSGYQ